MKVFIQKLANGEFATINSFQANEGFKLLGWEIEYFKYMDDFSIPFRDLDEDTFDIPALTKETVVVGGIPVINAAYRLLGVENPNLVSYPESLDKYMKRDLELMSMKQFRDWFGTNSLPAFIKPVDTNRKLFTGYVVKEYRDLIRTAGVSGETQLYKSEIVEFISEYRAFIHNKEIVGIKWYKGDFLEFINTGVVQMMVAAYKDAPVAYSLDVGVMVENYKGRNGNTKNRLSTALVEINDANALGCYGLAPTVYAKMMIDRWEEVMNDSVD